MYHTIPVTVQLYEKVYVKATCIYLDRNRDATYFMESLPGRRIYMYHGSMFTIQPTIQNIRRRSPTASLLLTRTKTSSVSDSILSARGIAVETSIRIVSSCVLFADGVTPLLYSQHVVLAALLPLSTAGTTNLSTAFQRSSDQPNEIASVWCRE